MFREYKYSHHINQCRPVKFASFPKAAHKYVHPSTSSVAMLLCVQQKVYLGKHPFVLKAIRN